MAGHALPARHRAPRAGGRPLTAHAGASIESAATVLAAGGLVVFPTESVYGLGADAASPAALDRLLAVRGREAGKPLLVLVSDLAMAEELALRVPAAARRLAARWWPGPLTIVLPARADLPAPLTAGTGTIGVRVPGHPAACALVSALGRAVTAPSANPPGAEPPRTADAARGYFGDRVGAYVDGGVLGGGASTVVAIEGETVRVLRAGLVDEADVRRALEE